MKLSNIRNLDSKFAWSFLGVMIGLIFGGLTIYSVFFQIKRPEIHFEILSDSDVLEFNEKIGLIDITYDGMSLSKNNQALRIITFRVINKGQQDILNTLYDDFSPLGFTILNGRFAEAPRVIAPNDDDEYFIKNLKITIDTAGNASFSKVIIECQKYFIIKALVIYNTVKLPQLKVHGKIAGMNSIIIDNLCKNGKDLSFWRTIINGSFAIQSARLIIYGIPFLVTSILFLIGIAIISSWNDNRIKIKIVKQFKKYHKQRLTDKDQIIFDIFLKEGKDEILEFNRFLSNKENINSTYNLLKNPSWEKQFKESNKDSGDKISFRKILKNKKQCAYLYCRLIKIGIIIQNNDGPKIDLNKKAILDDFISFVNIQ